MMINDLDTQIGIVEKPGDDSDSDSDSDSILPSSDNDRENSSTDCEEGNVKDGNIPTTDTESEETANAEIVATLVRKVLHNEMPDENVKWPLFLLNESDQSVEISQQDFQNIVLDKATEIIATRSHFAKELDNELVCQEEQRIYYKKYKRLLKKLNTMNARLKHLTRVPDTTIKHVRNVGTNVDFPYSNNH